MGRKKMIIPILVTVFVMAIILILVFKNTGDSEKSSSLLKKLDSYRGYTRVISKDEYDFYEYFVERDLPEEVSAEELDELVKEYAGKVNAAFYLGNQLDLCEPYSFEALQLRMEQENALRQVKLQQGEVVYGLEQFTLRTYFQYTMDNLQASLQQYLEENADKEILEMAEAYYEEHKEEFRNRVEVVYEVTVDGVTETLTADVDMLSILGKTDAGLADFLGIAEIDDTYKDVKNYQERTVVLKEVTYSEEGYENNADMALYRMVRNELYENVIENAAQNNPVEFEQN